jgi:hypothetical protein
MPSTVPTRWPSRSNGFGHVVYIEPDATVNHLDAVRELASELPCVAIFRNLAPDDPVHEIINFEYS